MYACTKKNDNLKGKIIFLMIFLILHAMDNKAAQYGEQQNFNTILCYVMLSFYSTSTTYSADACVHTTQHQLFMVFCWRKEQEKKNEITLKK